jgi:HK97 family phage major capsid protein
MPTTPTEAWTYVEDLYGLAKLGEDEFDDSDQNLEAIVIDSFARGIASAEDTGFVIGAGHASDEPVGFMTTGGGVTGITSTATTYAGSTTNAPAVIVDDMKALIYAVDPRYRRNGAFMMSSATELFLSTVKDGDQRYLWEPNTQAGRPNTFQGFAIHNQADFDSIAATKKIAIFGDFNAGYRVLDRQGMTIHRLDELYAEEGMVGFKVRYRVGGDVRIPGALKILTLHS